jgi:hypothetical protein
VAAKFNIPTERYGDFKYLCYLDIEDKFVANYVNFHMGMSDPVFKDRLSSSLEFWIEIGAPQWLLEYIGTGITIPFSEMPPRMVCKNNSTVLTPDSKPIVRDIIEEYLKFGFIEKVDYLPYCVLPLQLKVTPEKNALIYDMSKLNVYVQQSKFKLESWPEMFDYATKSEFAIKFDMKKFYHQIQINREFQKYFGFRYEDATGTDVYYVWKTMPYGYTRAPFIAKQLMRPLIARWRKLGALTVVFYDDGMAVSESYEYLAKLSLQMQCDLIRAGLVPGANKCIWVPVKSIDWNGLTFDFERKGICIKADRIRKLLDGNRDLMDRWPQVSYRDVAKCTGRINSMYPVFGEQVQIRIKMLQTIVNVRHYKDESWDARINVDYVPLYFHAYGELEYWATAVHTKNFRSFHKPVPDFTCWTDASDVALGGCIVPVRGTEKITPVTIDNILIQPDLKYVQLGKHAGMYPDLYPWSHIEKIYRRDTLDSLVESTEDIVICHRNFSPEEMATSSTERELLAVYYLVVSAKDLFRGKNVTIHTDSLNCQIICTKGSSKPKLQAYASLISDVLDSQQISVNVVWIPRDLNMVADFISNSIDFADYEIVPDQFEHICHELQMYPDIDLFANSYNAKCHDFFSVSFEPGSIGVDAFKYDWSVFQLGWIFVQPSLIGRALLYAERCKAHIVILIPQWKSSYFYPMIQNLRNSRQFGNMAVFAGKNMFRAGFDATTVFSAKYDGNVEIWELNFKD